MNVLVATRPRARKSMCIAIAVLCTACAWSCRATAATSADFFKPAKLPNFGRDPAGIYPLGQKFGIGLYTIVGNSKVSPAISNMHRAAQAGFTLAGPYYDDNWRDFTNIYATAKEGLKFTYQIRPPTSIANVAIDKRPAALDQLTDSQMADSVREQVTAILNDPVASATVSRWSLGTEEIRYWYPGEVRYLKVASDTIRAVEEARKVGHRPFWMYEPNHRNSAGLEKTGVYQDIISKGSYLTNDSRGSDRSGHAIWSLSQTIAAATSLKKVPQAVFQLSQDFTDPKTGADSQEICRVLRHDAYLGLVMGIKGMNIYSMYESRPNFATHDAQFQAYASVATDLTGRLNLQRPFLFGEPRSDLRIDITAGSKTLDYTDLYGTKSTYDTLHALDTAIGSDRYLFLVNSTEQSMEVKISGLPVAFVLDDLFAGKSANVGQSTLNWRLEALGVTALRFRKLLLPVLLSAERAEPTAGCCYASRAADLDSGDVGSIWHDLVVSSSQPADLA